MERGFRIVAFPILVGVASWCMAVIWSSHAACYAYHHTPDVADFRNYVFPDQHGKTKFVFLFEWLIATIAISTIGLLPSASLLDKLLGEREFHQRYARILVFGIWSLGMCFFITGRSDNAVDVAAHNGWHGMSQPNAVVDEYCSALDKL